ncbi:hypothetical protein [Wolbachia endosymbiont of Oedothorax gibbosus]|uniref:hypothetical protein n=1 Tax=Wolbachia endosymbiont of Oedothorax gibbosus TaxID=931100 RepID=UPI002023FE25|nr:hypothetical protein [Wolbachia endosymbiont of Oedothorax gibbosus]
MAQDVEKKFKDVFERSPGAFPEGTSLEEKVNYIAKGTEALKAMKSKELENKMKNVAELNQKFESQKGRADEKVRQDFERIAELDQQYKGKGIFTSEKVAESKNDKKFQETANTLRETTTAVKDLEHNTQKKTAETSVQTDTQPSEHIVSPSVSKSSVKEKLNTEPGKKDNTPQPQENQKEEGFLSLLKRFVKKILEKLLGEDEKSVENARGIKEDAQRDTSNNEKQQKSMDQSSFININGKRFDLEPEKAFNYQDKALNISITYNSPENLQQDTISPHTANTIDLNVTGREYNVQNQLRPETEQHLQRDTASPNIANAINLNINGKEYSVQPGESFNYKSPGLEISVVNGHQQSKNFDKILNQDKSISEGLKQETKLENPAITPVNTPKVNEVNTGRER